MSGRGGGQSSSGCFKKRTLSSFQEASLGPLTLTDDQASCVMRMEVITRKCPQIPNIKPYLAASGPALPPELVEEVSCLQSKAFCLLISRSPTTCHSMDYLHPSLFRAFLAAPCLPKTQLSLGPLTCCKYTLIILLSIQTPLSS